MRCSLLCQDPLLAFLLGIGLVFTLRNVKHLGFSLLLGPVAYQELKRRIELNGSFFFFLLFPAMISSQNLG